MKKVIFWDFDGTLVYSNTSFRDSLEMAFVEYGYLVDKEEIGDFLKSVCSWYIPQKIYPDKVGELWWQELLRNVYSFCKKKNIQEGDKEGICRLFREKVINYNYQVYDDAREILNYCQMLGYENYIISNNFPELVDVVERYGLDKYFTDYILSSNIGYEKPRIEIFEYALEKSGYPEDCYMIGDNPVADVEGSRNAGMRAILVHNQFRDVKVVGVPVCQRLSMIKDYIS